MGSNKASDDAMFLFVFCVPNIYLFIFSTSEIKKIPKQMTTRKQREELWGDQMIVLVDLSQKASLTLCGSMTRRGLARYLAPES